MKILVKGKVETVSLDRVKPAHLDYDNYSDKLRVAMSRLRLCPPLDSTQNNILQYKEIDTCSDVFLRQITTAPPSTAPYDGPYKVIVRSGRVMKILVKGKVETVSLDRVKPAHLDNEPAIGTEKQRETQNNTRNSKNTATVRREPALKQNSEKKELNRKQEHRHGLWRLNMVRIWLLLHSIMLIE